MFRFAHGTCVLELKLLRGYFSPDDDDEGHHFSPIEYYDNANKGHHFSPNNNDNNDKGIISALIIMIIMVRNYFRKYNYVNIDNDGSFVHVL